MMKEAAFTELINKRSLEQLEKLENERVKELVNRKDRFGEDELILKFNQSTRNGQFQSTYTFPSQDNYPKSFNTKISKKDSLKYQQLICPITGQPAKYKDPLTQQPYANKEAFKIIREKYFQKEEEKVFVRLQVLNDLLAQKRDKLRRYHLGHRNLDLHENVRQVILKNVAAQAANAKKSQQQLIKKDDQEQIVNGESTKQEIDKANDENQQQEQIQENVQGQENENNEQEQIKELPNDQQEELQQNEQVNMENVVENGIHHQESVQQQAQEQEQEQEQQ